MTVHAAKGLEFDVTILPDLNSPPQADRSALRVVPGIGIGLKLEDVDEAAAYAEVGLQNGERDQAESKRLLYVALTRAREECILILPREAKKGSWAALLTAAGLESSGKAAPVEVVRTTPVLKAGKETGLRPLHFRFQTSITEVAAFRYCFEFHRRKFVQGWDDQVVALWAAEPALRKKRRKKDASPARKEAGRLLKELGIENKERGIALHRVLERVGESGLAHGELWLTEAYRQQGVDVDHPALEQLLQLDQQLLGAFLASPVGREIFSPEVEAYPEAAFQWQYGETLVHGAIDRLLRRPDGAWVVVDYKSSISDESRERYRFQVASYMVAVEAYARSRGEASPRVLGYLVDLYDSTSHPVDVDIAGAARALAVEIARTRENYTLSDAGLAKALANLRGGDHCFSCPYSLHCEIGLAFK
jgi:ATP-dependent exoDNAse (exonuclease V) beta subunit